MDIELPVDYGFLRRQCPNCDQQFKWHHGAVDGAPEDREDQGEEYFCPLCGQAADKEAFHTHEQVAYINEIAMSYFHREFDDILRHAAKGSAVLTYEAGDMPDDPAGLFEPHDMVEVQPPCHPWEPIKIPEDWTSPIHCLLCGAAFRV